MKPTCLYLALLLIISTQLLPVGAAAKGSAGSIKPFCEKLRFCMLQAVASESDRRSQQWVSNSLNNLMDQMCDMMVAAQIKRGLETPADKRAAICANKMQKMSCDKLLNTSNPYDIQLPQGCNQ